MNSAESESTTRGWSETILNRSSEQRVREFKYRFAQSLIFGLPVLALQWWGPALGGSPGEADRWIAVLQALLAGWVSYVAAAGMLVEGVLAIGARKFDITLVDASVALLALGSYLFSLTSVLGIFIRGKPFFHPLLFHWTVILLMIWCGGRWIAQRRRASH